MYENIKIRWNFYIPWCLVFRMATIDHFVLVILTVRGKLGLGQSWQTLQCKSWNY